MELSDIGFGFGKERGYIKLLQQSMIYVQNSKQEGFGVAMAEAMACRVPVIAGSVSAMLEVVGDAGLLVDPHNPEDLAEKIEMLIENKELYNELSKKGVDRIRNNFSKEKRKQKLKRIVEDMVK